MKQTLKILSAFVLVLAACGKNEEPELVRPNDLKPEHNSAEAKRKQAKWERFAEYLGINNNNANTEKELRLQLAAPSKHLGTKKQAEWIEDVSKVFANEQSFNGRRCVALFDAKEVNLKTPFDRDGDIKAYVLSYKLGEDVGTENVRNGYVVVPTTTGRYPILSYAHGDDKGVRYYELHEQVHNWMNNHIVMAPSFPGEPLLCNEKVCEGGLKIEGVGKPNTWFNDADELIGMRTCLDMVASGNGATLVKTTDTEAQTRLQAFQYDVAAKTRWSTADGNPDRIHGVSGLMLGSSRGGFTAHLALARLGAELKWINEDIAKRGNLAALVPQHSCMTTTGSASTVMMGEFRLLLEYLVKRQAEHMSYGELPGIRHLKHFFDAYLADETNSEEILKAAAMEVLVRDIPVLGPLELISLRDWSQFNGSTSPIGSMGIFHGLKDSVVPSDQSVIAYNALFAAAHTPEIMRLTGSPAPSPVPFFFRGFNPSSPQAAGEEGHVRGAYFDSVSVLSPDMFALHHIPGKTDDTPNEQLSNLLDMFATGLSLNEIHVGVSAPEMVLLKRTLQFVGHSTSWGDPIVGEKDGNKFLMELDNHGKGITPRVARDYWRENVCPIPVN